MRKVLEASSDKEKSNLVNATLEDGSEDKRLDGRSTQ